MALKYIRDLQWVGGLSLEDADVLALLGSQSASILEFGVGGSTMIFSQVLSSSQGKLVSLDTSKQWIDEVKKRLSLLSSTCSIEFLSTEEIPLLDVSGCKFDLVFIDGLSKRRLEIALKVWPLVKPKGILCFHDTRRQQDVLQMQDMIAQKIAEIDSVRYNISASNGIDSNISVIYKREASFTMFRHRYIDLQSEEESREMWTFGRLEDYSIEKGLYQYKGP